MFLAQRGWVKGLAPTAECCDCIYDKVDLLSRETMAGRDEGHRDFSSHVIMYLLLDSTCSDLAREEGVLGVGTTAHIPL